MNTYKTKGIVIRTIPFKETSVIAHIYTEVFGLQHYLIKGIRKKTSKRMHIAHVQPLLILDMEVYHSTHYSLQYIKEIHLHWMPTQLFNNEEKHYTALLLLEFLQKVTKHPEPYTNLFNWIQTALQLLDTTSITQIYHIPFFLLLQLSHILGFAISLPSPYHTQVSYYFNMQEGIFIQQKEEKNHILDEYLSSLLLYYISHSIPNDHSLIDIDYQTVEKMFLAFDAFFSLHLDHYSKGIKTLLLLHNENR